jgi:hypothetical protein
MPSKVATVLIARGVPFSGNYNGPRRPIGFQRGDETVFLEDLATFSVTLDPKTVTSRSERVVFIGALGRCKQYVAAHEVAHAADAILPAPAALPGPPAPPPDGPVSAG